MRNDETGRTSSGIWLSRDVMKHGIERVTVAPNKPCKNTDRYNAASNQQFWFAEFRKRLRGCEGPESADHEDIGAFLTTSGAALTEWDIQSENGVLKELDGTAHTSFSFFPSSNIKKEVKMKVYQRHITNYKLICDINPERSLEYFIA